MSVRVPSGSSADGLSQNVLRAILEPNQKVRKEKEKKANNDMICR